VGERATSAATTSAVTRVVFYTPPDSSPFFRAIAGGFIGRSIGEGRVTEQPKVRVVFSIWNALSWRGPLVTRGSGQCVRIKVPRLIGHIDYVMDI